MLFTNYCLNFSSNPYIPRKCIKREDETSTDNLSDTDQRTSKEKRDKTRDKTGDKRLCVICMEPTNNVLLLPCKHMCLCEECSKLYTSNICPICKIPIVSREVLFVSST